MRNKFVIVLLAKGGEMEKMMVFRILVPSEHSGEVRKIIEEIQRVIEKREKDITAVQSRIRENVRAIYGRVNGFVQG